MKSNAVTLLQKSFTIFFLLFHVFHSYVFFGLFFIIYLVHLNFCVCSMNFNEISSSFCAYSCEYVQLSCHFSFSRWYAILLTVNNLPIAFSHFYDFQPKPKIVSFSKKELINYACCVQVAKH